MIKALKLIGSREKKNSIDEESWNRWQAKFRKQEIAKIKLDIDNGYYEGDQIWIPELCGTHPPKRSIWSYFIRGLKHSLIQLLP